MVTAIGAVIALFLLLVVIRAAWSLAIRGVLVVVVVGFWLVVGAPYLAGWLTERVLRTFSLRLVACILATALLAAAFAGGAFAASAAETALLLKYGVAVLLLGGALLIKLLRAPKGCTERTTLLQAKDAQFYRWHFACCLLVCGASYCERFSLWDGVAASWVPLTVAIIVQLWNVWQETAMRSTIKTFHSAFVVAESVNATALMRSLENGLDLTEIEALYSGVAALMVNAGAIEEIEIGDERWVFGRAWYLRAKVDIELYANSQVRHNEAAFISLIDAKLKIGFNNGRDYVVRFADFGELIPFKDGYFFVSYTQFGQINRCICCGRAELRSEHEDKSEWYCSRACKKIESDLFEAAKRRTCQIDDAATIGYMVSKGSNAWIKGQKIFATGGQGHGHAAEHGNTWIDRFLGKRAKIVGDNNATNGPDRLVNGQFRQTKYCKSGARSVGAAFERQDGPYKYYDGNKPMMLEVPKDQYNDAVNAMAKKIEAGKVPGLEGITGNEAVNEAKKLIVKGSLTYQQAQNITKFCTIESLSYDAVEGAVVGGGAAGISFAITTFVFYVQTRDLNMALRVGVVQAGKTFARTVAIYIGAQQLHRLEAVQTLVKMIPDEMAPSVRNILADGLGVSRRGVSKALRGTMVTSAVLIAATTGPDLYKLARGRISGAEFARRLSLNTSGVAGSVAGGIAGRITGMAFGGPLGGVVGGFAGGFVGSILATKVVGWAIPEIDVSEAFEVMDWQIAFLARSFLLGAEEMDLVRGKLADLTKDDINAIHSAANRHSTANAILKPIMVEVVAMRPSLTYDIDSVIEACAEVAA